MQTPLTLNHMTEKTPYLHSKLIDVQLDVGIIHIVHIPEDRHNQPLHTKNERIQGAASLFLHTLGVATATLMSM